jgi:outer membrane protein assembly factor BamB
MVFIGSLDGNFYALDKETGSLHWYFTCKSAIHSNPYCYGDNVFFGCDDGRLYSINKKSGDLEWTFSPGYSINNDANNYITTPIVSDPIVEDGIVYFSVKGKIFALDAQTIEIIQNPIEEKIDYFIVYVVIFISLIILITGTALLYNKKNKNKP